MMSNKQNRSSPHYKGTKMIDDLFEKNGNALPYVKKHETTGEVTIKPLALDIIWGGDERYWKQITKDEPEKIELTELELVQVCWLEVAGSVRLNQLEKEKDYQLHFKLRMKPDAFGWNSCPVYVMVKVGNDKRKWTKVKLGQNNDGVQSFKIPITTEFKFTTPKEFNEKDKLIFGLYEIWTGRWKGGLVVEEVIISKSTT